MRIIADSHAFLWFIEGNALLSASARLLLEDPTNDVLVSVASIWELGIKVSIGKLTVLTPDKPFDIHITEQMSSNGFTPFPVSLPHVFLATKLPFHHRDPFDRILAAQSLAESIPIISIDAILDSYGVHRLW